MLWIYEEKKKYNKMHETVLNPRRRCRRRRRQHKKKTKNKIVQMFSIILLWRTHVLSITIRVSVVSALTHWYDANLLISNHLVGLCQSAAT